MTSYSMSYYYSESEALNKLEYQFKGHKMILNHVFSNKDKIYLFTHDSSEYQLKISENSIELRLMPKGYIEIQKRIIAKLKLKNLF